jgi:PKD repeat protein
MLGDGATSTLQDPQHTYGAGGSYTVTLTVTDNEGAESSPATQTVTVAPPAPVGQVFVGSGDIAVCSTLGDEATAALLDSIPGTVWTAGDNAYPDGRVQDFANCYEPSWGRHKARTRPSPGNHEYNTSGATPYYAYFGANAGPAGLGYYSYDLGDWHIISLNSNISRSAGSPQEQWLRADLASTTAKCVLAYWHHPRFSSGSHGSSTAQQALFQALYDYDADVVLVGHDHNYQRFAPQTPTGEADPVRGIRQFVVGTGGRDLYTFTTPIANTEAYNSDTWGVLKLTLYAETYAWEFVPVAGSTYTDMGSGACH